MGNDLGSLLVDIDGFMNKPKGGLKHISEFTNEEESFLGVFLRHENGLIPNVIEYNKWRVIGAKDKEFTSPIKDLKNHGEDIEKKISFIQGGFSSGLFVSDFAKQVNENPSLLYLRLSERQKEYEHILGHAKDVTKIRGYSLLDVSNSLHDRDEVYKRIFPSRSSFENYCNAKNEFSSGFLEFYATFFDSVYEHVKDLSNQVDKALGGGGDVDKICNDAFNGLFGAYPSRSLVNSYLEDVKKSQRNRADRIYGPKED